MEGTIYRYNWSFEREDNGFYWIEHRTTYRRGEKIVHIYREDSFALDNRFAMCGVDVEYKELNDDGSSLHSIDRAFELLMGRSWEDVCEEQSAELNIDELKSNYQL